MPAIEPTRVRARLYDNEVGAIVQTISSKYRSAFIEMAILTWLKSLDGDVAEDLLMSCEEAPDSEEKKVKGIRIQFFDQRAGSIVHRLASHRRPALIEMAIKSWLKTMEGKCAVHAFLVRGNQKMDVVAILDKIDTKDASSKRASADKSGKKEEKSAMEIVKRQTATAPDNIDSSEEETASEDFDTALTNASLMF